MIQLASKNLKPAVAKELKALQKKVNNGRTFALKVEQAQTLWGTKGGKAGKDAFVDIREQLKSMCVYINVCNSCEQNESSDIEHIYPKSFFPKFAFEWKNYILACKQCNTGHKLDKCHVLDRNGNLVFLARGQNPAKLKPALINPRTEDPNSFMILNMLTYTFEIMPGLSKTDISRVDSVFKILELNERDTLKAARKSAAKHYYETLERLVKIIKCPTAKKLEELLTPYDNKFDFKLPLSQIKDDIKSSYKEYIATYQHPSVWHAIKLIESKTNSKWAKLFQSLPEALKW